LQKKIILYNTSVGTLLEDNEKVLRKLRYVFDCFRERDDMALWWRPHPLSKAAYESMRPKFLREYERIIEEYRQESWGIYDDTPDLHRAIALSDVYYGDWSSLVALYSCTGKPVMIQDNTIVSKDIKHKTLSFEKLVEDGNVFWFTSIEHNGLYRIDKHFLKAEFMGSIPNEKAVAWRLYSSMTKHGGRLYFAPLATNEMAIYDIEKQEFNKIEIVN
jgi:hypothetical protein